MSGWNDLHKLPRRIQLLVSGRGVQEQQKWSIDLRVRPETVFPLGLRDHSYRYVIIFTPSGSIIFNVLNKIKVKLL